MPQESHNIAQSCGLFGEIVECFVMNLVVVCPKAEKQKDKNSMHHDSSAKDKHSMALEEAVDNEPGSGLIVLDQYFCLVG